MRDADRDAKKKGKQHKQTRTRGAAGSLTRDVNKQRYSAQFGFNAWLKPGLKTRQ